MVPSIEEHQYLQAAVAMPPDRSKANFSSPQSIFAAAKML
jgi:hypothetical protein